MMYGWHNGMGAGGWVFMVMNALALWALLAGVIWLAVRAFRLHTPGGADHAERILAERFAKGEITEEEYRDRLSVLRNPKN
ncbi:SHOCT domain-containing protein [Stackebrandtia nassauensis]|uniref:SHOCT domain-containing protein n=1 Tax=Stackebrandtia nassauensis (strain DSM 44728 / CIP 108903 / NRRL B-16338 / NBRC 102104 / LLR-40K-21) TaxID=446470 RepID=D3PXI3_STANL|nr:SHOCT domain-containing protein [Stackebrandtia nassauensis]ADD43313.1 conserved hypothetical protein [Stackebrandtia nassauensis DSM 44728]